MEGVHCADLDGFALQGVVKALVEEVPGQGVLCHSHWLQADVARKGDLHTYITTFKMYSFLVSCMQLPIQVLKSSYHKLRHSQ